MWYAMQQTMLVAASSGVQAQVCFLWNGGWSIGQLASVYLGVVWVALWCAFLRHKLQ
jgi:hypothetical protein